MKKAKVLDRIHEARVSVTNKKKLSGFPKAWALLLNEVRDHKNRIKRLEEKVDKQINKVKKDIVKGDKKKGKKDVSKLLKMDKKMDKKMAKC